MSTLTPAETTAPSGGPPVGSAYIETAENYLNNTRHWLVRLNGGSFNLRQVQASGTEAIGSDGYGGVHRMIFPHVGSVVVYVENLAMVTALVSADDGHIIEELRVLAAGTLKGQSGPIYSLELRISHLTTPVLLRPDYVGFSFASFTIGNLEVCASGSGGTGRVPNEVVSSFRELHIGRRRGSHG